MIREAITKRTQNEFKAPIRCWKVSNYQPLQSTHSGNTPGENTFGQRALEFVYKHCARGLQMNRKSLKRLNAACSTASRAMSARRLYNLFRGNEFQAFAWRSLAALKCSSGQVTLASASIRPGSAHGTSLTQCGIVLGQRWSSAGVVLRIALLKVPLAKGQCGSSARVSL